MSEFREIIKDIDYLTRPCVEFDFQNLPFDPSQFAHELVDTMYHYNGIGLAANQIGVQYRIFAMRASPENLVCFNPRIVMPSDERVTLEESCLSFPGLTVKRKRAKHIRVRFAGPNGEIVTKLYTGMSARVFTHELEHLDGKLFFEGINRFHMEQALRHAKNAGFDYTAKGLMKYAKKV